MRASWSSRARNRSSKSDGVSAPCVVDDQHEGLGLAGGAQEGCRGVEESKACTVRVERGRGGQPGEPVVELGQHLGDVRGARPELATDLLLLAVADVGAQGLRPRPIGGRAARLPTATPQHPQSARLSGVRELVRQPALADAGLAGE